VSGGRRQAVGATRRRNRHIARKRTRNATDGRTDAARAHRRIQDSGGGHVCCVLPTGAGVDRPNKGDKLSPLRATHGRRGRRQKRG